MLGRVKNHALPVTVVTFSVATCLFLIKKFPGDDAKYSGSKAGSHSAKINKQGRASTPPVPKVLKFENSRGSGDSLNFDLTDLDSENWRMDFYEFSVANLGLAETLLRDSEGMVSPQERADLYRLFAQAFSTQDVSAAIDWARNLQRPEIRNESLKVVFDIMIQDDDLDMFDKLNLIKEFTDKEWSSGHIAAILQEVDASSAQRAVDWIGDSVSGNPNLYYASIANVLSKVGNEDAEMFISLLHDFGYSRRMEESVAMSIEMLSRENPQKSLELIERIDFAGDLQMRALQIAISNSIVQEGPEWAMDYLKKQFPKHGTEVFSSGMGRWIEMDSDGALKWISELERASQEELYSNPGLLLKLGNNSPQKMLEHIDSFEVDVSVKNRVIQNWSYREPGEAAEWISNSSVSLQEEHIDDFVEGVHREDPGLVGDFLESLRVSEHAMEKALKAQNILDQK